MAQVDKSIVLTYQIKSVAHRPHGTREHQAHELMGHTRPTNDAIASPG